MFDMRLWLVFLRMTGLKLGVAGGEEDLDLCSSALRDSIKLKVSSCRLQELARVVHQ